MVWRLSSNTTTFLLIGTRSKLSKSIYFDSRFVCLARHQPLWMMLITEEMFATMQLTESFKHEDL